MDETKFDELTIPIKKGVCYYQKNDTRKYHVVIVLEEEKQVVVKFFGKHKQWWHYEIKSFYEMNLWFDGGLMSLKRIKKEK